MKIYQIHLINEQGESVNQVIDFTGDDARVALMSAIGFSKSYAKRGKHIRIACGTEIVWDSKINK